MNHDGFLDQKELFQVIKMMVGKELEEDELNQLVEKTIKECSSRGDDKISYEDFHDAVAHEDIRTQMSLRF